MAAAHAGVDDFDVPHILILALLLDLIELLTNFLCLCGFRQVIPPAHLLSNKLFVGNPFRLNLIPSHFVRITPVGKDTLVFPLVDKDTAKAVLHHVADNPVRGKQLGHGGDLVLGDLAVLGKGGVLRFGVVILVQPADDLHLTAFFDVEIILVDVMNEAIDHAFLIHHRKVQQHLGVIACLLEEGRKNLVQGIALLDEEQAEQLIQRTLSFQPQNGLLLIRVEVQLSIKGGRDQIRLHLAALRGQNADVGGQIVVDLHEADGNEAVEPGVGHLFQNILVGGGIVTVRFFSADGFHQLLPLADGLAGDGVRFRSADVIELHIGGRLRQSIFDALRCNAHQSGAVLDVRNELVPRPDRKVFDCSLIHDFLLGDPFSVHRKLPEL